MAARLVNPSARGLLPRRRSAWTMPPASSGIGSGVAGRLRSSAAASRRAGRGRPRHRLARRAAASPGGAGRPPPPRPAPDAPCGRTGVASRAVRRSSTSTSQSTTAASSSQRRDRDDALAARQVAPDRPQRQPLDAAGRPAQPLQRRRAAVGPRGAELRRVRQAHRRQRRRVLPGHLDRAEGRLAAVQRQLDGQRVGPRPAEGGLARRAALRPAGRGASSRRGVPANDSPLRSGSRCSWTRLTPSRTSCVSSMLSRSGLPAPAAQRTRLV